MTSPFVHRVFESPVFSYYGTTKTKYWTHNISIGHHWFVRLSIDLTYKVKFSIRLEALRLIDFEFNIWWPGA
jgi:hypothetical protein